MNRRSFLRIGLGTAGAAALGPSFWARAYAAPARLGTGPYGPLLEPDANGVRLPEGFTSRIVARSGSAVEGTGYTWHLNPDGGATYRTDDGGWIYVSNSEVSPANGGAGALRFDASGSVVDAYPILTGTSQNCAGGPTPWGTWLSCEEHPGGQVWECDPFGEQGAVAHVAMGAFSHEAVAVDPDGRRLYLTEDVSDGRYYRYSPDSYPDLSAGLLEAAELDGDGFVTWHEISNPAGVPPTRTQAPISTAFNGGEGIWFDGGQVYFTTKGDDRVWVHDLALDRITVLYDAEDHDDPVLTGVDNITVAGQGDLYVAEDGGDMELVLITADDRTVAPFLQVVGHEGSEIVGPAFDPSFSRLYFSSQRGGTGGITFEVSGPFRQATADSVAAGGVGGDETAPAPSPPTTLAAVGERQSSEVIPATGADLPTGLLLGAGLAGLLARHFGHPSVQGSDRSGSNPPADPSA